MARDYEDLYDLDNQDDTDIYDLIRQELNEYQDIDTDLLDIRVENGFVILAGRVGTEQELQEVQYVVSDLLGIANFSNEIVIDELVRAEHSEGADDAIVEDEEVRAQVLGESGERTDPQADHLQEDLDGQLYGTRDLQSAVSRGETYEPPDRPVQEGTWSEENH